MHCRYSRRLRLLSFVLLVLTCWSASRSAATPTRRVVLVLLPGLQAADLDTTELRPLDASLTRGAAGWMICRAAVPPGTMPAMNAHDSTEALLLTIGAGARAATSTDWNARFNQKLPGSVPLRRLPPDLLSSLATVNRGLDHTVVLGALGDLVHSGGRQTAVLAASDADVAFGLLVAMDHLGAVDLTILPQYSDPDTIPKHPLNPATTLTAYDQLPANVGLVVYTTRTLERNTTDSDRKRALGEIAAWLSALERRTQQDNVPGEKTTLIVCAPGSSLSGDPRDRSAPILMWGDGIAPGSLTSASTRRSGLAVNTDLLPTVAARLGLPVPAGMVGRPISSIASAHPPTLHELRLMHDHLLAIARLQNLYGGLPTVQMLLILCGAAAILLRRTAVARAVAACIAALPLGMLILPPFAGGDPLRAGLLLALFALTAAALAGRTSGSQRFPVFMVLCAALVIITVADLLTGMHLLRDAWMSYSVMEGARYYGIGNEYMGALIGASCVLFPTLLHGAKALSHKAANGRRATADVITCYLLVLAAMGMPMWGAKVGAIPSAGCAFGVLLLTWRRGKATVRDVGLLLIGAAAILALLAVIDLRHGAEQSHLVRALTGAGGDSLPQIAMRKLLLEARLLLRSSWNGPLLVAACVLAWLLHRSTPTGEERPVFAGIMAGAIASLFFNDSGITAATLTLLYGCALVFSRRAATRSADSARSAT
jgi:hypothetical protein